MKAPLPLITRYPLSCQPQEQICEELEREQASILLVSVSCHISTLLFHNYEALLTKKHRLSRDKLLIKRLT